MENHPPRRYDIARTSFPGERRPIAFESPPHWIEEVTPPNPWPRRLWTAAGFAMALVFWYYASLVLPWLMSK